MDTQELLSHVTNIVQQQNETLSQIIADHTHKIQIMLETTVTNRIDALFDGYKLTHEKQWEQERKIEEMQAQIENLQLRLITLENKST